MELYPDKAITDDLILLILNFIIYTRKNFHQEQRFKVSSPSFALLFCLYSEQTDQPLAMSHLKEVLNVSKQQLSQVTKDLEDEELIERLYSKENRRIVSLRITDKGLDFINSICRDMTVRMNKNLSSLTEEERHELKQSLLKLSTILNKVMK